MRITIVLFAMVVIPIILIFVQWYLCKKSSKLALILPLIVACFTVIVGFLALGLSAVMFLIYFVHNHLEKQKRSRLSEIEKMNIEDL